MECLARLSQHRGSFGPERGRFAIVRRGRMFGEPILELFFVPLGHLHRLVGHLHCIFAVNQRGVQLLLKLDGLFRFMNQLVLKYVYSGL